MLFLMQGEDMYFVPVPLTCFRLEQGALTLHEAYSHEGAAPKYVTPVPFLMSV